MLLVLMALTGLAVSVATASRLVRLSSDLNQSTWRLRSAWTGRATARRIGLAAELNALELAIDEVVASVEAQAAREDERHHQRARLDTAVMVLKAARERGGVPRLHDHDGDDLLRDPLQLEISFVVVYFYHGVFLCGGFGVLGV